jgi:hypothetical protein
MLLLGPDRFIQTCRQRFLINAVRTRVTPTQWHIIFREWLSFLLFIAKERTKCGMSDTQLVRREIIQRLAITDMTYSQLTSVICRRLATHAEFDTILNQVATYQQATENRMCQCMFAASCIVCRCCCSQVGC